MAPGSYPLLFGRFPNYYELLGINSTATKRDVHLAYRKAALAAHPDKAGNTAEQNELCAAINNAKAVLIDEVQRRDYDHTLRSNLGSHTPQVPPQTTKAPPQHDSSSTSFTASSRPKAEPRSNASGTSSGSATWNSGSGSNSSSGGNANPFDGGSGSGAERSAPREARAESAHSSKPPNNAPYPSAGCPICDSLWCPGAAHRRHGKLDEIPCTSRGPRGFAPKSTFGGSQQESSQSTSGCTRDHRRCPIHRATSPENTGWKTPKRMGDPNYIEPNCTPIFGYFAPPATAYDRSQHNGTKPDSAAWRQARWRCFSLSEEHQSTVNVTFSLCNMAGTIERTGRSFVQACSRMQRGRNGEALERLAACVDLIGEVLHFVAAAYRFHSLAIDGVTFKPPSVAIPQLILAREQLNVILQSMLATNTFVSCLAEQLCRPHMTDLSADVLLGGLKSVLVEWDCSIMLPDTITEAAQEIFFSRKGDFQNSFQRISQTTGYPVKPFIFKDRKHVPWSGEAELPTLRAWEAAQRRRENQHGIAYDYWANESGFYNYF